MPQKICPFCKSHIPADALKCAHCGEWLSGESPTFKRTYLILALLLGPIAEFYVGKITLGFVLFLIEVILFIVGLNYPPCVLLFAIFIMGYWNHVFNYIIKSGKTEKTSKKE